MFNMPLGVQSYAELYLTILGWSQYNAVWTILVETGLVYLPFIAILFCHISTGYQSANSQVAQWLIRRAEYDMVMAIFVIMLALQPMVKVEPQQLTYAPRCHNGEVFTPGHTDTTYDDTFTQVIPAYMPVWWYAVLGISQGITSVLSNKVQCLPDARAFSMDLELTKIDNPQLRDETVLFHSYCFGHARAKFYREQPDASEYIEQYGYADLDWLGSKFYLNTPGYYDTILAPEPIAGFPYAGDIDWEEGQLGEVPEFGRPHCAAWWYARPHGLQERLYLELSPYAKKYLADTIRERVYDNTIKTLVKKVTLHEDRSWWTSALIKLGIRVEQVSFWPKMHLLINARPMIQATLIFLVVILLPWTMLLSAYRPGTLIKLAFVLFSLKFFSYLWALVDYLDQVLLRALYPNEVISSQKSAEYAFAEMLVAMLYILLPAFWLLLMSWVGQAAGNGIQTMLSDSDKPGDNAGNSAGNIVKGSTTRLLK